MVSLVPVAIDGKTFTAVTVRLPNTNLISVSNDKGYIMCGALDVPSLNTRLAERRIIAGRAFGVRSVDDLLEAPLVDVTDAARELGSPVGRQHSEVVSLLECLLDPR